MKRIVRLKQKIKKCIIDILKWNGQDYTLFQNINLDLTKHQKRILVCYLDFSKTEYVTKQGAKHTNYLEFIQMIKVLVDLELRIDVCSFQALSSIAALNSVEYDYILGMGEVFREVIKTHDKAQKILYMTENPYIVSYSKEKERLDYFYERHKIKAKLERTGLYFKKGDEDLADYIICVGDKKFYQLSDEKLYRVSPTGLRNLNFANCNVQRSINNFLVFGTEGFIHKGIDIIIDIFNKHPDWNLYICGNSVKNNIEKYHYILNQNIMDYGFIDINSQAFITLVSTCTFVLLLSCSEASPTGVLTCMRHGLIPIVMKDLGMEKYKKYCFILEDYHLCNCEQEINRIKDLAPQKLVEMSNEIYDFANQEFSLEEYTVRFRNCMEEIVERNGDKL